jgi:2-succinyl-6-hydroxy-2,4-cyclohexadiene-1-carboxylate synthase
MTAGAIERTEGLLDVSGGDQIWYETAGEGPDLVLCHGLGGNTAVWFQQVPHFARRYRVISWDQRGFGRSSNAAGLAGPATAVTDLSALLDHLEITRAAVVGQSMGGWAALGFALDQPSRVAALVLACTTAGIPQVSVPAMDPALISAPPRARPLGQHPALGERLARTDPARAYLYQTLGTFGHRYGDGQFARLLADHQYAPESIEQLMTPTLLICGELDPMMSPARVRDVASRLPNGQVVEFADRGHSPYFEDPGAWNDVVDEFLDRTYPPA